MIGFNYLVQHNILIHPFLELFFAIFLLISVLGIGKLSIYYFKIKVSYPVEKILQLSNGILIITFIFFLYYNLSLKNNILNFAFYFLVYVFGFFIFFNTSKISNIKFQLKKLLKKSNIFIFFIFISGLILAVSPTLRIDDARYTLLFLERAISDEQILNYSLPFEQTTKLILLYQFIVFPFYKLGFVQILTIFNFLIFFYFIVIIEKILSKFLKQSSEKLFYFLIFICGLFLPTTIISPNSIAISIITTFFIFYIGFFKLKNENFTKYFLALNLICITAIFAKLTSLFIILILYLYLVFKFYNYILKNLYKLIFLSTPFLLIFIYMLWSYNLQGSFLGVVDMKYFNIDISLYDSYSQLNDDIDYSEFGNNYFNNNFYSLNYFLDSYSKFSSRLSKSEIHLFFLFFHPILMLIIILSLLLDFKKNNIYLTLFFIFNIFIIFCFAPLKAKHLLGLNYFIFFIFAFSNVKIFTLRYLKLLIGFLSIILIFIQLIYTYNLNSYILGIESKSTYFAKYIPLYNDFNEINKIIDKDSVIISKGINQYSIYSPRKIFYKLDDINLSKNKNNKIFLLFAGDSTLFNKIDNFINERHKYKKVYENFDSIIRTSRLPFSKKLYGTIKLISIEESIVN